MDTKESGARPRVHLLCNAHIDPVWLWEWEEGAAEAISTFRTAADLCEAFDGFVFNHNEVLVYQWVEEYEPGLFARIQRLVDEGRWHIMGGWFLQPDCNMPSGESFVRQILVRADATSRRSSVSSQPQRSTSILSGTPAAWCRSWPKVGTIATSSAALPRATVTCPTTSSSGSDTTDRRSWATGLYRGTTRRWAGRAQRWSVSLPSTPTDQQAFCCGA